MSSRVGLGPLAAEFLLVGTTGVGGNLGLLVHRRVVAHRGWLDEAEFARVTRSAALAPGGTSTALVVGVARRLAGPRGVVVATACAVLPGTALVLAVLALTRTVVDQAWVVGLLHGAAAGGVATLLAFLVRVAGSLGATRVDLAAAAGVLVAAAAGVPVPLVLVLAGAAGYAVVTRCAPAAPQDDA